MSNESPSAEVDQADREMWAAESAFVTGRFFEYWQKRFKEAQESLEAMYNEFNTPTGGSGEDSGSESNGSLPVDG